MSSRYNTRVRQRENNDSRWTNRRISTTSSAFVPTVSTALKSRQRNSSSNTNQESDAITSQLPSAVPSLSSVSKDRCEEVFMESINVIVRCRGRGYRESEINSPNIISISEDKPQEVKINIPEELGNNDPLVSTSNSRIYKLDKVYGPTTDQMTFFQNAAENICDDFLKGFNCTLFAYGQTGSGKTYTMCGKMKDNLLTPESGIIPRCLNKLFESHDNERSLNSDIILKCSFVEIYNEILKDLLSDGQNDNQLKIYEQGKTIKIKSLEEFHLKNFNDAMKILNVGLTRRKTASTKMNHLSSRSHTIFTIYLMKKRPNGSEYQYSKMNLVDLAGSENINRSGSINQRAKEAGSINQSLLTLGRVINCLVDGSTFIPYRESKLTRLLQDSLGGRTRTILVANIAPTLIDLQSSLSTLDYASKAKNIKNSVQIGSIIKEDLILNDLIEENRRLKLDLFATRKKENCITIDNSNYHEMVLNLKNLKDEVLELRGLKDSLLKQLENQLNKNNTEREERHRLVKNIQALETRNIEIENNLKMFQNNEVKLKKKVEQISSSVNDNLVAIFKLQENMKNLIFDSIFQQVGIINNNINSNDGKIALDFNDVRRDINMIIENINVLVNKNDELSHNLNNIKNDIKSMSSEFCEHNTDLISKVESLIERNFEQTRNNSRLGESMTQLINEENSKKLIDQIKLESVEFIESFKVDMFNRMNELIDLNLKSNVDTFSKFYRDRLIDLEGKFTDENVSNSQKAQNLGQQIIQKLTKNDLTANFTKIEDKLKILNYDEINKDLEIIKDLNSPIMQKLSEMDKEITEKSQEYVGFKKNLQDGINKISNNIEDFKNNEINKIDDQKIKEFLGKLMDVHEDPKKDPLTLNNHASNLKSHSENNEKVFERLQKSPVLSPLRSMKSPIRNPLRSPLGRSPKANHWKSSRSPFSSPTKPQPIKRELTNIENESNKRFHR